MEIDWTARPELMAKIKLQARVETDEEDELVKDYVAAALYPYVTIDSEQVVNATPISGRLRETRLLYLSVWSDYQGQAEVKRLNGEICAALNERRLPLTVGRVVSMRVLRTESNREPDGRTYMGSVTVRVITTH